MERSAAPQPDLGRIFRAFTAFHRTAAIKAAVELDVFTAIAEGATTARALTERCGAAERGIRILCDALAALGLLTKAEGRYGLTDESAILLDRNSPGFVGSAIRFIASPLMLHAFSDVAAAVRKGGTVLPSDGALEPEHPMWVEFARAMAPLARINAELLANLLETVAAKERTPSVGKKILDIAAGHGLFGITLAKRDREASVVALDWPNVLTVAQENAEAAGISDRYRTLAGSALTSEYGKGYDLVLVTNFFHHFDPTACGDVLRKVHAALAPGGRAVVVEFVPNEDRVSPQEAATFSLVMLVGTPGGDAYTFADYERMFRDAGFTRSELHELPPSVHRVLIAHT